MNDQEDVTVLAYVEERLASGKLKATAQETIDSLIRHLLSYRDAPRIYEVIRDVDGRYSIIWVTRTRKEWDRLILEATLNVLVSKLGDLS